MKTTIKKIIVFVSVVVTAILCFAFSSYALDESGKCGDNVYWNYDKNTGLLVLSGKGDTYGEYDDAYYYSPFKYEPIKKIVIENGITKIGPSLFENCNHLETVTLPDSVTVIGAWAFWGCSSLKSITIPANVKDLGYEVFDCCYNLESLTVIGKTTDIKYAFGTFPDNLSIYCYKDSKAANYAKSEGLNYIFLDGSDKDSVFSGKIKNFNWKIDKRTGVLEVTGKGAMPDFDPIEAPWYEYRQYTTSIKLSNGITRIGERAFYNFYKTSDITLPDSLEFIDNHAFQKCSNLKRITIPSRVEFVFPYAFQECDKLEEIVFDLDEKNQSIMYHNMSTHELKIKEIIFPKSVACIDEYTFPKTIEQVTVYNPDCKFDFSCGLGYKHTIIGFKGSTAEAFAEEIGATFVDVETVHKHNYKTFNEPGYCVFSRCTCGKEKFLSHTDKNNNAVCDNCKKSTNELEVGVKREFIVYRDENPYFSFTPTKDGRYTLKLNEYCDSISICDKNKKILKDSFQGEKISYELKAGEKVYWHIENYNMDVCCLELTISFHAHSFEDKKTTPATLTKNGKLESKCYVCGYSKTSTIYYPKTFSLSTTSYTYNGKAKSPTVTVKDSKSKVLKKGTDYKVTYESGRKNTGKYSVRIDFIGKYSGTKRLYFTIAPKETSKITASQTTSTITLKWNKVTGADGYRVYKYNTKTKKYEKLKDVTGTSLKISQLSAGTAYKYKVRAYKKDDGTIWGKAANAFATATKCATPSISKLTTSGGKVNFTWSNVSGESGFQVYYSTKKDKDYKKIASYKANVLKGSKSKLTKGKTYYFKVRAYKKTDSGTVFSSWSSIKNIKVK